MPSKDVYDILSRKGLKGIDFKFNKYDTLESDKDIELLFDVLNSVKDRDRRPAVMTPLTVIANPDFEKIRSSGFSAYYYEGRRCSYNILRPFYNGSNKARLYKQG